MLTEYLIYYTCIVFRRVPSCSVVFRHVPSCSVMFPRVPVKNEQNRWTSVNNRIVETGPPRLFWWLSHMASRASFALRPTSFAPYVGELVESEWYS